MQTINIQIPIELIEQGETFGTNCHAALWKQYIYVWASTSFVELFRLEISKMGENHIDRQYDKNDLAEDIEEIKSGL